MMWARIQAFLTSHWRQVFMLVLIAAILVSALMAGLTPQGLAELLRENRQSWSDRIADHPLLAAAAYTLFYVMAVTISLPGALWFTIGAGYLLGPIWAIPVSLIGVTVGATNIFLIARYVAGERFHHRFDGRIGKFAAGFRLNDFTYIIFLRMVPVPFFLVNVAAALLGARLRQYTLGTLIGTVPATLLYINIGAGLGELLDAGVTPGWSDLQRPSFLIVLAMSILLAFVPLLHRRWRNNR
ncbi:VTT domain-containing protein [Maricaulis sp.]|uniref:TVP38/TMEM64 family protein n=1 Tax=Maricaulis sp. TaxID=1486257 RepID=UPI002602A53C|nr:VTT domain-containing protein [Maricaulis sp.]